jgi:hypothetical protein
MASPSLPDPCGDSSALVIGVPSRADDFSRRMAPANCRALWRGGLQDWPLSFDDMQNKRRTRGAERRANSTFGKLWLSVLRRGETSSCRTVRK